MKERFNESDDKFAFRITLGAILFMVTGSIAICVASWWDRKDDTPEQRIERLENTINMTRCSDNLNSNLALACMMNIDSDRRELQRLKVQLTPTPTATIEWQSR